MLYAGNGSAKEGKGGRRQAPLMETVQLLMQRIETLLWPLETCSSTQHYAQRTKACNYHCTMYSTTHTYTHGVAPHRNMLQVIQRHEIFQWKAHGDTGLIVIVDMLHPVGQLHGCLQAEVIRVYRSVSAWCMTVVHARRCLRTQLGPHHRSRHVLFQCHSKVSAKRLMH